MKDHGNVMDNGVVSRMNRGFGFLTSDLAIFKKQGVFSTVAIGDLFLYF